MSHPETSVVGPYPAAPIKLPYQVVSCSSHDDKYPPASLEHSSYSSSPSSPSSSLHGWQSARNCVYPQVLVLSFGCLCSLQKVQLLSHQSKIAKNVEVYAGTAETFIVIPTTTAPKKSHMTDIEYTRLGSGSTYQTHTTENEG